MKVNMKTIAKVIEQYKKLKPEDKAFVQGYMSGVLKKEKSDNKAS